MCTVVVRWEPGESGGTTRVLALRDELTSRAFDDPKRWWPEHPDLVGGRDRTAGGTWCASAVSTGVTALVLNRPQRRQAAAGAPSRGVLPLLAATHGRDWTAYVDLAGMASFALVLVSPHALTTWAFDGTSLESVDLPAGTHMVTSGGAEDGKADRYLEAFAQAEFPDGWRQLVESAPPADDLAALVVRHELGDRAFATVFGQLIESEPGRLHLELSRTPWSPGTWRMQDHGPASSRPDGYGS